MLLASPSPTGSDEACPEETAGQPRLAIATGRYLRSGETFVNRHIECLFGGNTVVICGRRTGADLLGRPVFSRLRHALNPADVLAAPLRMWSNHRRYSAPFVPFGRGRGALETFLRRERVDAVLAEFGSQAVSIWPVCRDMGLPVFAYFRGRDASLYLERPARVEGYRRMFPELAGVFAVSRFLLDNLAWKGLVHPNAHVVPSGTDVQRFRPGEKVPGQVAFVGRFVEKKAPLLTLRSFLAVAARHPQARLDMIGDGPDLRACRALAAASPEGRRVTFHGHRPPAEVQALLARAEIFVLHSVTGRDGETEGLPSVIQEAMASGAAILSTRHAGIPELVREGVSGHLVAEQDAAAFTGALDRLLADPEATRRMGAAARTVAEAEVDFRRLYRKVEDVIRVELGRRARGAS